MTIRSEPGPFQWGHKPTGNLGIYEFGTQFRQLCCEAFLFFFVQGGLLERMSTGVPVVGGRSCALELEEAREELRRLRSLASATPPRGASRYV